MARRKNTRFIDPRYFMDEKMERLDEQAPGSQIFEPGSSDQVTKRGTYTGADIQSGETSEPSAYAADVVQNLSPDELALALQLEGVRTMAKNGLGGSAATPYSDYADLGAEPPPPPYVRLYQPFRAATVGHGGDRQHMLNYIRNLGLVKDGKFTPPMPALVDIGSDIRSDRAGKGLEAKIMKATYGENLPQYAYVVKNLPRVTMAGNLKPFSIKDPISGDTFSFTPMLSESGLVHSVKIG